MFELEAAATIPAEYVLLEHYMDRITPERQARIGAYLRRNQGEHGGWPMFHADDFTRGGRGVPECLHAHRRPGDAQEVNGIYFRMRPRGREPFGPPMGLRGVNGP